MAEFSNNEVKQVQGAVAGAVLEKAIEAFNLRGTPGAQLVKDIMVASLPSILGIPPEPELTFPAPSSEWESLHYANDLIAHQPKFKFLFKVLFRGFGVKDFYYYVTRCDKPKVSLSHTDVNYYGFRTKVLTGVSLGSMSMSFHDEIGNTVNAFFVETMRKLSGQASGTWGIDRGAESASKAYEDNNGYSAGREIIIEQIFANGYATNRFHFINPRIESFDFDALDMAANDGSVMSISFNYDALSCETIEAPNDLIYNWGDTDLLRGGGTSGYANAGSGLASEAGNVARTSVDGSNVTGSSPITKQPDIQNSITKEQMASANSLPVSLADLSKGDNFTTNPKASNNPIVFSGYDVLSRDVNNTLNSIYTGSNLRF
jgi:hypothetical protein